MSRPTVGHTANGTLLIPETQFIRLPEFTKAAPLRGYGHVLAVVLKMAPDTCVGWIAKENLGQ